MQEMNSFCKKERKILKWRFPVSLKTGFKETYLPPKKEETPTSSRRGVMANFHQALGHADSSLKAGASGCYLDWKKTILFTKSLRMLLKKDYTQYTYSPCFTEAQFPCHPRINRSWLERVFTDLKTNSSILLPIVRTTH